MCIESSVEEHFSEARLEQPASVGKNLNLWRWRAGETAAMGLEQAACHLGVACNILTQNGQTEWVGGILVTGGACRAGTCCNLPSSTGRDDMGLNMENAGKWERRAMRANIIVMSKHYSNIIFSGGRNSELRGEDDKLMEIYQTILLLTNMLLHSRTLFFPFYKPNSMRNNETMHSCIIQSGGREGEEL